MNLINRVQFLTQANDMINMYDQDNRWFMFLTGGVWEKDWLSGQYICVAHECYQKVPHATAELLLLGDTKIRKEKHLVSSFSLSSAKDETDPEVANLVADINKKRNLYQQTAKPYDPVKDKLEKLAPNKPLPVADEGSILSTRGWSPMLNDAFIMGGAHANINFFLALNKEEGEKWGAMRSMTVKDLTARYEKISKGGSPAKLDDAEVAKGTWLRFFRENPQMLWDEERKIPRVFMRELIGLASFGYKPRFNPSQLGFLCADESKADGATLPKYMAALRGVGFEVPNKEKLLQTVGNFLFEDAGALTKAAA
ncbi:MAG: hypothetical protein WDO68_07465 [Gammaproteobacteria bacterium]